MSKLWAFMLNFTLPAHQIWSWHVIQVANLENVQLQPNSELNIRKSQKISSSKKALLQKLSAKDLIGGGGGGGIPSAFMANYFCNEITHGNHNNTARTADNLYCRN